MGSCKRFRLCSNLSFSKCSRYRPMQLQCRPMQLQSRPMQLQSRPTQLQPPPMQLQLCHMLHQLPHMLHQLPRTVVTVAQPMVVTVARPMVVTVVPLEASAEDSTEHRDMLSRTSKNENRSHY